MTDQASVKSDDAITRRDDTEGRDGRARGREHGHVDAVACTHVSESGRDGDVDAMDSDLVLHSVRALPHSPPPPSRSSTPART